MKLKMMMAGIAIGALAVVSLGATTYDNQGFKAVELYNIDQFEIYAAPSFEVSGDQVAVSQDGAWLTVSAPSAAETSIRIGMPEVHEIRVTASAGTVTRFSMGNDLIVKAAASMLQLHSGAGHVSIHASNGAAIDVDGRADSLVAWVRDSEIAVTDFDAATVKVELWDESVGRLDDLTAVRAEVVLRDESVGRIDGLGGELAYRVYDEAELYYAPGTRLGQPYYVSDEATFETL